MNIPPPGYYIASKRAGDRQMKYIIIKAYENNFSWFIELINKHLQDKWKLQGGVCMIMDDDGRIIYAQAMTYE